MKKLLLTLIICLPFWLQAQTQTMEVFSENGNIQQVQAATKTIKKNNFANRALYNNNRVQPAPIDLSSFEKISVGTLSVNAELSIYVICDAYHSRTTAISTTNVFFQAFLATAPMSSYKSHFNCYAIYSPLATGGVNHRVVAADCAYASPQVPKSDSTSYFLSQFDYGGTHRLLYAANAVDLNTVFNYFGAIQGLKFVNIGTQFYGGSGGTFACFAGLNSSSPEIAIHEFGHSFAGLADEYCSGNTCNTAPDRPNATTKATLAETTWANVTGAGMIVGANYCCSGLWKRPFQWCKMLALFNPFCKVCSNTIEAKILSMITVVQPQPPTVTSHNYTLDLNVTNSISLTANGADSYYWTPAAGLLQTTGQSVVANTTITTSYTITGKSNATGLSDTAHCTVTVVPKVIVPTCVPVDITKLTPVKIAGKNYFDIYVNKTNGTTLKFSARQIQNQGFSDKTFTNTSAGVYRIQCDVANKLYEVKVICTEVGCAVTSDLMQGTTAP